MVIDTSALIAILQDEPERRSFNEAIEAADGRKMSVASFVEASMIIESRFGPDGYGPSTCSSRRRRSGWSRSTPIRRMSPEARSATTARGASRPQLRRLLRICLGETLDEPLLFKGQDFPLTDVMAFTEE